MRLPRFLFVFLLAVPLAWCQDETSDDVFAIPSDVIEGDDVISSKEGEPSFQDQEDREELNEGSDTFEVSTAVVETEGSMRVENSTEIVEGLPIEATETNMTSSMSPSIVAEESIEDPFDAVATNTPATDETEEMPSSSSSPSSHEEVTSSSGMTSSAMESEETVASSSSAPEMVASLDPSELNGEVTSSTESTEVMSSTESTEVMSSSLEVTPSVAVPTSAEVLPTLEHRVLKEKEQEAKDIKDATTEVRLGMEKEIEEMQTTTAVETTGESVVEKEGAESTTVESVGGEETQTQEETESETMEETETVKKVMETSTGAERDVEKEGEDEATTVSSTMTPIADMNEENVTMTTTTASETTEMEVEGELPFDQDKLSGVFEADGSFISTDTEDSSSTTPAFPMVALPSEESAEVIGAEPKSSTPPSTSSSTSASSSFVTDVPDVTEATTHDGQLPAIHIHPIEQRPREEEKEEKEEEKEEVKEDEVSEKTLEKTTEMTSSTEGAEPRPQLANRPRGAESTMTMRITSIDYMDEFADPSSGKFAKLQQQIVPEISSLLRNVIGEDFVSFSVDSLTKGSVVVNGRIVTHVEIQDAEDVASRIESALSANGSLVGGNTVDAKSITVNGIPSRAFIDRVSASVPSSAPSTLLVGSVIGVAIVVILAVALLVIMLSSRRSNRSMKLRDDEMSRMESGKRAYSNPQAVNLCSMSSSSNSSSTFTPPPPTSGSAHMASSSLTEEREII